MKRSSGSRQFRSLPCDHQCDLFTSTPVWWYFGRCLHRRYSKDAFTEDSTSFSITPGMPNSRSVHSMALAGLQGTGRGLNDIGLHHRLVSSQSRIPRNGVNHHWPHRTWLRVSSRIPRRPRLSHTKQVTEQFRDPRTLRTSMMMLQVPYFTN